ncbi:MAG: SMC-Scp complex subunit ScpB [Bryobacteraceae bacterium]|jgi:segregation and condensation protein B
MDELEVKEEAPQADAEELPMVEEASVEEVIAQEFVVEAPAGPDEDAHLKAIIEAAIYITDEPLTPAQISAAIGQPAERVNRLLDELTAEYNRAERGLSIREIAGGFKMATKPEHHEAIRTFVKNLKPPMKLSLPALETLAVIAYKQPVTAPEIMEIRGVQGIGVLKTLLDRKLIAAAGRKQVVGKPILYKTTKEFLVQFGLRDLAELPTLKEFEELGRLALSDEEEPVGAIVPADPSKDPEPIQEPGPEPQPERDPDPGENPGDPQHQPVKAESSSGLSEEDKEPAA